MCFRQRAFDPPVSSTLLPLLFDVYVSLIQWLLGVSRVKHGRSTKGSTDTFRKACLDSALPPLRLAGEGRQGADAALPRSGTTAPLVSPGGLWTISSRNLEPVRPAGRANRYIGAAFMAIAPHPRPPPFPPSLAPPTSLPSHASLEHWPRPPSSTDHPVAAVRPGGHRRSGRIWALGSQTGACGAAAIPVQRDQGVRVRAPRMKHWMDAVRLKGVASSADASIRGQDCHSAVGVLRTTESQNGRGVAHYSKASGRRRVKWGERCIFEPPFWPFLGHIVLEGQTSTGTASRLTPMRSFGRFDGLSRSFGGKISWSSSLIFEQILDSDLAATKKLWIPGGGGCLPGARPPRYFCITPTVSPDLPYAVSPLFRRCLHTTHTTVSPLFTSPVHNLVVPPVL